MVEQLMTSLVGLPGSIQGLAKHHQNSTRLQLYRNCWHNWTAKAPWMVASVAAAGDEWDIGEFHRSPRYEKQNLHCSMIRCAFSFIVGSAVLPRFTTICHTGQGSI